MTATAAPAPSLQPALYALVPCAGIGERAAAGMPKQYAPLLGQPVVAHTLNALAQVSRLSACLVVLSPNDTQFEQAVPDYIGDRHWLARCGGATRAQTVANGLNELQRRGAGDDDWVLVHDAARCLLQPAWVDRLIDACLDDKVGGLLALPLADTLKHAADGRVAHTVPRADKWAAQTPQMFRIGLLREALALARAGREALAWAGEGVTDESSAVEAMGLAPLLVAGDVHNIKLTYPGDFALAGVALTARLLEQNESMTESAATPSPLPPMRIGEGWDTHALVLGRPLVLGGVTIPHSHGLLGHSDADALLHAITDALFGAAGLGDIGQHFPDTEAQFKGADSMQLLAECARRVRAAGWAMANIDATIVAQAPKMAPHIPLMRERIAATLGLALQAVNVKAKTAEKMGPVGEGRAIEARAVCLLVQVTPFANQVC